MNIWQRIKKWIHVRSDPQTYWDKKYGKDPHILKAGDNLMIARNGTLIKVTLMPVGNKYLHAGVVDCTEEFNKLRDMVKVSADRHFFEEKLQQHKDTRIMQYRTFLDVLMD